MRTRLAVPFLGASSHRTRKERNETKNEVYAYYKAIKSVQPYINEGVPLEKLPKLPSRPEILGWLDRVERWGFPNPGTFLDQPVLFLAQIEGAEAGRKQALAEARGAAEDSVFRNAPAIGKSFNANPRV